jgi:hypothetical protein
MFETEHVIDPLVKFGDRMTAGQRIATVSDYDRNCKAMGTGWLRSESHTTLVMTAAVARLSYGRRPQLREGGISAVVNAPSET